MFVKGLEFVIIIPINILTSFLLKNYLFILNF